MMPMDHPPDADSPKRRQEAAQSKIGYGPIHLVRIGDYAIVSVEIGGIWYEVIREHIDGNFSHIIEPLGILEAVIPHPVST